VLREGLSRRVGLLCSILLFPSLLGAAEKPKTVRLLTVGNSFSQNATHYLNDIAKSAGDVLIHHQAAIPGGTLEQHCDKFDRHERDPNDPRGLYSTRTSLKQELTAEPWDVVTIQQASVKSHDVSTYRPFARQLADVIHRAAPNARLMVHQTWAYRRDDPRFSAKSPASGEPRDQEAMYRGLSDAYRTIADELDAAIIPVGDAFHLADGDPEWGYRPDATFDPANAMFPMLPLQGRSLHVGWKWSKKRDGRYVLEIDGHHANVAGEYLGACVFYEVLFGKSVVGNPFLPGGLNADYGRFLQETAHRAVAEERRKDAGAKTTAEAAS
jgi:Domain of unknown function (DUF4886)